MVALLLLLLMPLGLLHRSSSDACRYDRGAISDGGVAALSGIDHDVDRDVASPALVDQVSVADVSAVVADEHDHHGSDLPQYGAASSACGPAAVSERPLIAGVPRAPAGLPVWRALSPVGLAAPPPAPPPRLS